MDKSAYLDAMGITRWVEQSEQTDSCIILIDKQAKGDASHPIIKVVLSLFNIEPKQISFSHSLSKSQSIFWDMRSLKLPKVDCVISSGSIVQLEQDTKAKQALWALICESKAYGTN